MPALRFRTVQNLCDMPHIRERVVVELARELSAHFGVRIQVIDERESQIGAHATNRRADESTEGRNAA